MAFGAGGIKASLPTHGGDQLDRGNPRLISRFFNWFYFSICCGSILAVTIVVSIEESKGWFWSFTISAGTLALALFIFMAGLPFYRFKSPTGSSLTRITKVIVSAARNRNKTDLDEEMIQSLISTDEGISHTKLK